MRPKENMQVTVRPNTYLYLALLIFLVPAKWLAAWLLAVSFHEFCHWAAVMLCGGKVYGLTIGVGGAKMESSPLPDGRRLFAVLCGPIGGLLLVFLGRWLPRTALCSWLLSVYNLLPLLPLDGGRALEILLGEHRAFAVLQGVFLILLSVAALYASAVLRFGILPVAIIGGLWLKHRKSPCKRIIYKVQ